MEEDFTEMYIQKYVDSVPVKLTTEDPHMLFKSLKAWVVFPIDLSEEQLEIVVKHYPFMRYLWKTREALFLIRRKCDGTCPRYFGSEKHE